MEKLLESFKTLGSLGTQILFLIEAHETLTDHSDFLNIIKFKGHYSIYPFDKSISGSLLNYSLIMSCSFIDEYNEEFSSNKHPEYADRILRLKKITKPVIKRINKWTDFKDFRNNILAHNFRIKGKSFFAVDVEKTFYNVPHTNSEIVFLSKLLPIITTCISQEFPEMLQQLDLTENLNSKLKFNYPSIDIDKELTDMWTEINLIKASLT